MAWFHDLPLDFTKTETRAAERLLLAGYSMNMTVLMLAQNAGLNLASLNQMAPVKFLIREALENGRRSNRLLQLFVEVLRDAEQDAIHPELRRLFAGHEAELAVAAMTHKPSLATIAALPPALDVWAAGAIAAEPLAGATAFQKLINVHAGFADVAVFRQRLVEAEVRTAQIQSGGKPQGTGFLVGDDLLLTNWHVVKSMSNGGVALFDHKVSPGGLEVDKGRTVKFAVDWLVASSGHAPVADEIGADGPAPGKLDFALVRLAEPVGAQVIGPDLASTGDKRGCYRLDGGAYDFESAEPLLIVGHPDGRPMQLSYSSPSEVRVTKHGNRLRYQTNTEGGSSGSPVFNRDWRVVALHHAAGPTSVPGEFNSTTNDFNQGIPISAIVTALREQFDGKPALNELGLA